MSLPVKDGGGNNVFLVSTLISTEHAVHHVMMGSDGTAMRVLKTLTDGTVVISGTATVTGAVTVTGGATEATLLVAQTNLLNIENSLADITRAEDAIHASGARGVVALSVRRDTPTPTAADGDYTAFISGPNGGLWVEMIGGATSALQTTANTSLDSIDGGVADLNTKAAQIASAYWADGATPTGHRFTLLGVIDPIGNVAALEGDLAGRLLAPAGVATEAKQDTTNSSIGATNEAAAANDTAVSGTNGLLKRLLARMTTLLAGLPASLGQALMAASFPVAIASNQSAVPTIEQALVLDGQAAQTAVVNNILEATAGANGTACENLRSGSVQVTSTGTGGTFIFEQSNDNVNWVALPVFNAALVTGVPITAAITATISSIIYTFPVRARFVRLRIATTITGGSIRAFSRFSSEPWTAAAQLVASNVAANMAMTVGAALPTGANTIGTVNLGAAVTRAGFIASAGIWYDDSSTNLAGAAVFTGTSRDATVTATATAMANAGTYAKQIRVFAESDVTGTLVVQLSRDNTNWRTAYTAATASIAAIGGFGAGFAAEIKFEPAWRYWRVCYVNGAGAQARFALGSIAVAA